MPYRAANLAPCIRGFEIYAVKFCPANLYRRILRLEILLGRICIAEFRRVKFCLKFCVVNSATLSAPKPLNFKPKSAAIDIEIEMLFEIGAQSAAVVATGRDRKPQHAVVQILAADQHGVAQQDVMKVAV